MNILTVHVHKGVTFGLNLKTIYTYLKKTALIELCDTKQRKLSQNKNIKSFLVLFSVCILI